MDDPRDLQLPPELDAMARRLKDERPTLSGLELDQIKLHVNRRADRPKDTFLAKQRRTLMKSRMAITSMLVVGVLAGGTGTGLAVSGVSASGSAGKAQYPSPPGAQGKVLGKQEANPTPNGTDVAGTQESRGDQAGGGVQATRQVSVQKQGGKLPFTGLAAIPLILIGVGLLATGVVLHRRLPAESA